MSEKDAPQAQVPVPDDNPDEARKRLLAQVAGTVATGIMIAPSKKTLSATAIADVAVDIAEAILKKIGL